MKRKKRNRRHPSLYAFFSLSGCLYELALLLNYVGSSSVCRLLNDDSSLQEPPEGAPPGSDSEPEEDEPPPPPAEVEQLQDYEAPPNVVPPPDDEPSPDVRLGFTRVQLSPLVPGCLHASRL